MGLWEFFFGEPEPAEPPVIKAYRIDGQFAFKMKYQRENNGTYTLWCLEHPEDPHGCGVKVTHLYESGQICVTSGQEPRTLDRVQALGQLWMKSYAHYLRTGVGGPTGGRVNV